MIRYDCSCSHARFIISHIPPCKDACVIVLFRTSWNVCHLVELYAHYAECAHTSVHQQPFAFQQTPVQSSHSYSYQQLRHHTVVPYETSSTPIN